MTEDATEAGLLEVLRVHAEKTEQDERPTPESLDALRALGALAVRTPRVHGGTWANTVFIARQLTTIGRACPSSAWVAGTSVTAKNLVTRAFPEATAAEVFADPDTLFCGSGVPAGRGERVPGGVRVTGRWPNVSGCEDAVWAGVALMVDGAVRFAVVPVAELSVDRTWHMAGMRGTGSHTLVAEGLLVPDERVGAAPFTPGDRLLYAMTVLGPVVGAAQGALDATTEMFGSDRKPFMTAYSRMGESPGARHWLAEAAHLVHRAENTMLVVADEADSGLSDLDAPPLQLDLADAARDCRAAVDLMLDLHGASGFRTTNRLQRLWRDVAVGSRHPHLNPYLATENLGAALVAPLAG